LLFAFLALAVSSSVWAQADVIEKRQQAMKDLSAANKAIKSTVESKDYANSMISQNCEGFE